MTITENLDTFLADFGVPVVSGLVSGLGILEMPDQIIGSGMAISAELAVTVKESDFGNLNFTDSITVDGTGYKVKEVLKLDDGKFVRITLSQ